MLKNILLYILIIKKLTF